MAKTNWIQNAIEHPGAFKKKAKNAGISTSKLASKSLKKKSKASTTTKKQAVLAQTLASMRKKKK
jgi:hypothetical protein